jgi:hypothetical protein
MLLSWIFDELKHSIFVRRVALFWCFFVKRWKFAKWLTSFLHLLMKRLILFVRLIAFFWSLLLEFQAIFLDIYEKAREGLIARYILTQSSLHITCIYYAGSKFISAGFSTILQLNSYLKITNIDILNYEDNSSGYITKTEWVLIFLMMFSIIVYFLMI